MAFNFLTLSPGEFLYQQAWKWCQFELFRLTLFLFPLSQRRFTTSTPGIATCLHWASLWPSPTRFTSGRTRISAFLVGWCSYRTATSSCPASTTASITSPLTRRTSASPQVLLRSLSSSWNLLVYEQVHHWAFSLQVGWTTLWRSWVSGGTWRILSKAWRERSPERTTWNGLKKSSKAAG